MGYASRTYFTMVTFSVLQYAWPGNVRELLNFSQRLSFFLEDYWHGDNGVDLLREMAPDFMQTSDLQAADQDLRSQMALQEEAMIVKVLDKSTTLAEAAAQLGIPKTTLWRKIQKIKEHRS